MPNSAQKTNIVVVIQTFYYLVSGFLNGRHQAEPFFVDVKLIELFYFIFNLLI